MESPAEVDVRCNLWRPGGDGVSLAHGEARKGALQ
jgi:hypothetical protein